VFRMGYSAMTFISSHTREFYMRLNNRSTKNERNRGNIS
jgi:hypothetical protein